MDSQFVANILIFQVILQELQYLTLDNGVVQWLDFHSIAGSDWINLIPWTCKEDKSIVFTLQGTVKGQKCFFFHAYCTKTEILIVFQIQFSLEIEILASQKWVKWKILLFQIE